MSKPIICVASILPLPVPHIGHALRSRLLRLLNCLVLIVSLCAGQIAHAARMRGYAAYDLITMYCPGSSGSVMADGRRVHYGAAAAWLPLYTRVTIPGLWRVVIEDRVGYRPFGHIDVWTASCAQAIRWGARYERVWIYR